MKKIAFVVLMGLFSLVATTASAQIARWGITGGMNVSKIDWKNVEGTNPESEKGWYAGITGRLRVPAVGIGVDGGLLYSQECIDPGTETSKSETAQFLSIPVHLRYDLEIIGVDRVFIPFAMIGPQFNYALNDLKFEDFEGEDVDGVVKQANSWRLDMGLGCILLNHLQLSYSYGIPVGSSSDVDSKSSDNKFNYKLATHRVGLTYYF